MNGRQEEHLAHGRVHRTQFREYDDLSIRCRPPLRDTTCQPRQPNVHFIKREKCLLKSENAHLRLELRRAHDMLEKESAKSASLVAQNAMTRRGLKETQVDNRLANMLIERIAQMIRLVLKDPQILGFEMLPEFLLLLDRMPFLDVRLSTLGKQIRMTLTDPSWQVARRLRMLPPENVKSSSEEMNALSALVEFTCPYDLKVIACISGDPLWIGLKDNWTRIPMDLRYQAAATLDRSWLAYRNLWCRSPPDLRWVAVFFGDKRWLHNCIVWENFPIQTRMKAICAEDPLMLKPEQVDMMLAATEEARRSTDCCCRAEVKGLVCTQCPLHCHLDVNPETHPEIVRLRNELKALIEETLKEREVSEALSAECRKLMEDLSRKNALLESGLNDLATRRTEISIEFEEFQRKLREQRDKAIGEMQKKERSRLDDLQKMEDDKRAEWDALRRQVQAELDALKRAQLQALADERAKQLAEVEAKKLRELQALREAREKQMSDLDALKADFIRQLDADRERMERDIAALKDETQRNLDDSERKLREAEADAQKRHAEAEKARADQEQEMLERQRKALQDMRDAEEAARRRIDEARARAAEEMEKVKADRTRADANRIEILKESPDLVSELAADVSLQNEKTPVPTPQPTAEPTPEPTPEATPARLPPPKNDLLSRVRATSGELIKPRPTADQMANVATTSGVVSSKATAEPTKRSVLVKPKRKGEV